MRNRTRGLRRPGRPALWAVVFMLLAWTPFSAGAEGLRVELNKLEPANSACRAYLLFENRTSVEFETLRLDLVMFNPEGIINRRLAVEGGPLPAGKTSVKLFDIEGVACDSVERVLLNGVLACGDAQGDRSDCLDLIETASRSSADFFK
jgi:hypothetical protein